MSDQKQLRFSMIVDQNTVQQFSAAIQLMQRQLDQLTKSIAGASSAMGGLLGGGHVGGAKPAGQVISQAGFTPGTPGIPAAPAAGGGGKPASLSDIFLKNSQAFTGMANSSTRSMKVMSDGLKEAVRQSEQNLARLNKELKSVADAYDKVANSAGKYTNTKNLLQTEAAGVQTQIAAESKNLKSLQGMQQGPGAFGQVGQKVLKAMGVETGGGGILGAVGMGGIIAAAVAGAVKMALQTGAAFREERMLYGQTAANRGQLVGGAAMAMWNNDYKTLAARYLLGRDGALRGELKAATADTTGNNLIVGGQLVANALKRMVTLDFKGTANKLSTIPQDIEFEKLKDREQMIQNFVNADPMAFMKIQSFYDSAAARTSQARRLGYMYSRKPGGMLINAAGNVEANLVGRGYSMDQGIQALSAVSQFGGEYAGRQNMLRVLGAQSRGFGGAAALVGLAAQGAGTGYVESVFGGPGDLQARGQIGVGLLERAAGQGYGQYDQSALLGLMFGSGMLLGGAHGGTDMLAARQLMGGLETMDRRFTGGVDAFGKAMGIRAVQAGMGGAAPQAKDYVANMPFARMLAVASGKAALSPVEIGLGVTKGDISSVMRLKMMDSVRRVHGGGNTIMGRVASAIGSSGMAVHEWAAKHTGFTRDEALQGLAAINMTTPGVTPDAAIGEAGIMLGMSAGATKKLARKFGLGDAIAGTAEEKANIANAKKVKELNDSYAEQQKLLGALADVQKSAIDKTNTAATNMAESAETLNESFQKLSETIDKIIMDRTGNKVQHAAKERGAKNGAGGTTTTAGGKAQPGNK